MKSDPQLIAKARQLYVDGKPIDEVSRMVGLAKGTLWPYLCDIKLSATITEQRRQSRNQKLIANNKKRASNRRNKWQLEMEQDARQTPRAIEMSLVFLGLGLYWAEGTKNERKALSFSNADPRAIRVYIAFLREVGADIQKLNAGLVAHRDVDLKKAQEYWAEVSGIPINRIYPTHIDSTDSLVKQIYGALDIRLQDAEFSRKVFGWLRGVQRQFEQTNIVEN